MITTTTIKIQYSPSSSTSTFSFPIPYFSNSDINVEVVDSGGTTTTLTLDAVESGFSVEAVNGEPNNGATITTTEAVVSGESITIYREVPLTQEASFLRGGDIPPEVLNTALDRLTCAIQQVQDGTGRGIDAPVTDPDGLNYSIGTVAERANKVLTFDANGNLNNVSLVTSGAVGVDSAAGLSISSNIISAKVDGATVVFDGTGQISVGTIQTSDIAANAVTTAKIADSNVTFAKIEDMTAAPGNSGWVLGNMAAAQAPYEVFVDSDDTMAADSNDYLATQAAIKGYIDAQIAASSLGSLTQYESAETTIPASLTPTTVTHGLGSIPILSEVVIRCKTTDQGYAVGDEVILTNDDSEDATKGYTIWKNSTQYGFIFNSTIRVINKSTGAKAAITTGNWKLVFRGWA